MMRKSGWYKSIWKTAAVLITALLLVVPAVTAVDAESRIVVPVRVSFEGTGLPSETFTVSLRDTDTGRTVSGSVTLSSGRSSGAVDLDLGELVPGTYVYELYQASGSDPDITYSSRRYTYYVEVGSDGASEQRAVNKEDPSDKPDMVEFANSYVKAGPDEVIGDPPVRVRKLISGKEPPKDERFVFIMRPEEPDYPLPDVTAQGSGVIKDGAAEVYLNGEGEIEIGNIRFTREGVYRYFVSEKDTAAEGYDYDDARFTVTYSVSRDQSGALTCSRTITKKGEGKLSECSFDNIYDPNPVSRRINRGVKTGDPGVMWPLTALLSSVMILITLLIDRRNRREAGRGKR